MAECRTVFRGIYTDGDMPRICVQDDHETYHGTHLPARPFSVLEAGFKYNVSLRFELAGVALGA
jgi:hypothetical protein